MKTILFTALTLIFTERLFAQFTIIQPEVFTLATITNYPCPVDHKGKIFYNTNSNQALYCSGIQTTTPAQEYWAGATDIYYLGKIGLGNAAPTYELDVSIAYNGRIQTLLVGGNVGVNTLTPTEKLEVKDRRISIVSSVDAQKWNFEYRDTYDRFEIQEINTNTTRMYVNNGGNIGIGTLPNTNKLAVSGNVSYAGNVNAAGKGLLQNTNAVQLKMVFTSLTTKSNNFYVDANSCATTVAGFSFPTGSFTSPPAVAIGQNIIGNTADNGLILSVEGVTQFGGYIKFCNNKSLSTDISGYSYALVAIGEGN